MSWLNAESVKIFPGERFSASEGIEIQKRLSRRLNLEWDGRRIEYIAGADVHFRTRDTAVAAVSLYSYPGLEQIESQFAISPCDIPYIPGLLSFREIPAILHALGKTEKRPDIILCDGQGIAHPRRLGLATHLGIVLGIPTVGCAKSRLYGDFTEPGGRKGDRSPLTATNKELLGYVVRTRDGVKPLFVSPGNLVDHEKAVEIVLNCTPKYRISEPLRSAHREASRNK